MTREEAIAFVNAQPEGENFTVLTKSGQVRQRRINGENNRRFTVQGTASVIVAIEENWQNILNCCEGRKTVALDQLNLMMANWVAMEIAR